MLILNNDQIGDLLSLHQIIAAVEEAIVAYEENSAIIPQRMHMDKGESTLLCMPSWGSNSFGTKLVAVAPGNASKNLPVTNGAMLLNDGITGIPLALINASKLTALRTGAVGALGIKCITPENETSVGLVGCGVQGIHQILFACAVRPIKTVYYFDPSMAKISEMSSLMNAHHPGIKLNSCANAEELLGKTQTVIAATTSTSPVLPNDERLLNGKHFISIGSYKPTMQELPDAVYKLAGELCIDSDFARAEVGDIINPVDKKLISPENVFTIGKLLRSQRKIDVNKTTVFKSAGMALFDLYVAQAIYQEALKRNIGTLVKF